MSLSDNLFRYLKLRKYEDRLKNPIKEPPNSDLSINSATNFISLTLYNRDIRCMGML